MSFKSLGLIPIIIICLTQSAIGQSISDFSNTNLRSINVDDLSDQQVQSFLEKAQASGYSQSQLEILARARGMSELQISKLRERFGQLGQGGLEVSQEDIQRLRNEPADLAFSDDPFELIAPLFDEEETEIFGRNIFSNPQISFEPSYNIPTPENYLLGAGDEIIIDIWGASEQNYQLIISPEGSIRIPNLGPIYLNGLSIKSAKRRIFSRLKQIYSSLGQNTFAEVSLGQLKTIRVNIVGEATVPGTYAMSSFSTVYTALYMAGGPSQDGTLRAIEVYREGNKIEEIDLFKFLFEGKLGEQILRDQDVIIIRPYEIRVEVLGEVKRPMIYELKAGETVENLLKYTGGFSQEAYQSELTINRVDGIRRKILTINEAKYDSTLLLDGDEILVGKIIDEFKNRVVIDGAVYREGAYELTNDMTLSALIKKAEGLKPDAFEGRGLIWRQKNDNTLQNISFPVSEVVNGNWDISLNANDSVMVQSIFDLKDSLNVKVDGEVRIPGSIQYVDSLTVEDVIFLAGGFKESASRSLVEVSRRLTKESESGNQASEVFNFAVDKELRLSENASLFKLEPFDLVVVRKSPFYQEQEIVEVEGEARFPGVYALEMNNERISSLLRRAGGLTINAYPNGATLIRRTEYFVTDEDDTNVATKIRREDLNTLFKRDTLAVTGQTTFKAQESIGIDLERILTNPGSKYDLILKKGDVLSIPRELQTVRIRGEVLYPSTVRYDGTGSLKYYLSQAGGFTDDAKLSKAYVIYANGSAARTKRFLWFKGYPKVEPGAEVIVPKRVERRKLSVQEILGISSSLLSMVLIIDRLIP